MAGIRLLGGACAVAIAFVSTTAGAQDAPFAAPAPALTPAVAPALSPAATLWHLRSALNVAALACRGEAEAALVAGYNNMLADHRAELDGAYGALQREYRSPAAYDDAMTRLYNTYAQPASQAALCDHAGAVLDAVAARGAQPLAEFADTALAFLETRDSFPAMQLAVAAIPQILDQRAEPAVAVTGQDAPPAGN